LILLDLIVVAGAPVGLALLATHRNWVAWRVYLLASSAYALYSIVGGRTYGVTVYVVAVSELVIRRVVPSWPDWGERWSPYGDALGLALLLVPVPTLFLWWIRRPRKRPMAV